MKKDVLRKFAKFTEKHLCQSLFFAGLRPVTLLKKRLWHRCFPVKFAKFLRTPFSRNISGRLLLYIQIKRSKDYQDFLRVRRFCHNMKDLYLQLRNRKRKKETSNGTKEKQLHGKFVRETEEIRSEETWQCRRKKQKA